jgi:PAS domain S-box-containing protein
MIIDMPSTYAERIDRVSTYLARLSETELTPDLFDDITDAVVVTDASIDKPGPTILYVNRAFEELTGYTRDELLGHSPRMLQGYDTDLCELARMKRALQHGECFAGSVLNYRKSGIEYVVGWAIAPVRDSAGKVKLWISVQNDVICDARNATRNGC